MADDYIIPLGIDSKGVVDGINETLGSLDKMDAKAKDAGKTIEESFSKSANAANKLDDALKPTEKSLEDLINTAKTARGELGNAFNVKKEADEYSKILDKIRDKIRNVSDKTKLGIEIDPKALKEINAAAEYIKKNYNSIKDTFSSATDELNKNIGVTKENITSITTDLKNMEDALKGIAPGQAQANMMQEFEAAKQALTEEKAALNDYETQLGEVSNAQKDMAKTLSDVDKAMAVNSGSSKTLRQQYLEVRRELQKMEHAGESNTDRFKELTKEAANLKTSLDVTQKTIAGVAGQNIKLRATMQGAQGLIGLFTAYQGVMALVGTENEEVEKVLLKVNGAMSILYATQSLLNIVQKDSALSIALLNRFRKTQTAETKATTAATAASVPVTKGATLATRALGVAFKALGIGLIVSAIAYLVSNWDELSDRFKKFLPAGEKMGEIFDDIKVKAMGVGTAIVRFLSAPIKALVKLVQGDIQGFKNAIAEGFDFSGNYQEGANKQMERNEANHLRELEIERIKADERDLERRKARGEDVEKLEIALQKRRIALEKEGSKARKEAQTELENMEDRHIKNLSDKQKQAYQERLRIEKEAAKQLQKLGDDLEQARINQMEDATKREIATVKSQYAQRIRTIQEEEALTADAREKQTQLIESLVEEREKAITDIEKKATKERVEFQLATREKLNSLQKESVDTQLEDLSLFKEKELAFISETYKDEEDLRIRLISALEEKVNAEQIKIKNEWTQKQLKEEEERQILTIELMQSGAKKSEETERQKQIAILTTKLEFSKKYLDALIAGGASENSLEVLQAKKTVKDISEALNIELDKNKGKGFDMFEFLGMGDLTSEEKDAVTQGAQQMMESFSALTDTIISNYDAQIAKRQENINSIQGEIDTLESELERENNLREQGFASNAEAVQRAIDIKKQQQEEEIRQQKKIQKEKEKVQKAQMAADTAMQAVNLITASTNIFESFSAIPFGLGIPLAIATVGLMLGAFAAAKIKASKAISTQKYEEGGWIDGPSHSRGGTKYYGEGGVKELEGDEFVVKKKQAKKYGKLLEAINDDKLDAFTSHDKALASLMNDLGISFVGDSIGKALKEGSELKDIQQNIVIKSNSTADRELRQMNRNIDYLAQKEREKTISWSDDKFTYIKKGSTTTRLLKNE